MTDIFKNIKNAMLNNNSANDFSSDVLELTEPITEHKQKAALHRMGAVKKEELPEQEQRENKFYDDGGEEAASGIRQGIYQNPYYNRGTNIRSRSGSVDDCNINEHESIISSNSAKETANEIGSLLRTINNKKGRKFHKGVTLEDLVIEAIKPQLAGWMNENLADLVRGIVEKEIKKLISEGL